MEKSQWHIATNLADVETNAVPEYTTESGVRLSNFPIAFTSWGALNAAGDNCIVVCHALTGNTDASDWWSDLFGPGRVFDSDRYFIVCLNVPGSPYGSVSPLSVDTGTGERFGRRFPEFTVRDTVAVHRIALEAMGVRRIRLAAGGSLGGMQAAEWAFHSDFVDRTAVVACGASHSSWCIGWSNAQRAAIRSDPQWNGGDYDPAAQPANGLGLARQIAMMTYRSAGEYDSRFGRKLESSGDAFSVESYLEYQGQKLVARFDANCYIALTSLMDTHDIRRNRSSLADAAPTLVVGVTTDILYPLAEQRELARLLPQSEYAEVESPYGHDGFLIEQKQLNVLMTRWLHKHSTNPTILPTLKNSPISASPVDCGV